MGKKSRWDYFKAIYRRYQMAGALQKSKILDEFCANTGYHRKYAIWKLNGPLPKERKARRASQRKPRYSVEALRVIEKVWESAGYPWSTRLREILRQWMPWIKPRFRLLPEHEKQLLAISARQIDRRLKAKRTGIQRRIYGRTKPGKILKHQIPIRTHTWDIRQPGFTEVDLVSHSGNSASGEFAHSLNQTDVHTGWVETRAVLGKGEVGIVDALQEMSVDFPFPVRGIDSDNGSEFINMHLLRYCQRRKIQFTRGRPYAKQDNAHIEQKNWTHVRKLMRWDRYSGPQAAAAMNDLYRNELRLMMNLFQPSVKLIRKQRVGSRLQRHHDTPQTPLDRLCRSAKPTAVTRSLLEHRKNLDPFVLSSSIDKKLDRIWALAERNVWPRAPRVGAKPLGHMRKGLPLWRLGFKRRYNPITGLDSLMS